MESRAVSGGSGGLPAPVPLLLVLLLLLLQLLPKVDAEHALSRMAVAVAACGPPPASPCAPAAGAVAYMQCASGEGMGRTSTRPSAPLELTAAAMWCHWWGSLATAVDTGIDQKLAGPTWRLETSCSSGWASPLRCIDVAATMLRTQGSSHASLPGGGSGGSRAAPP
jgi:hypothetical protein